MYLCYIDESGDTAIPGSTNHYILAGIAIPILEWKKCEKEISIIKQAYHIQETEIHTAFMLRDYSEQNKIANFEDLDYSQRRIEVQILREARIKNLNTKISTSKSKAERKKLQKTREMNKRFYKTTNGYIHLTFDERRKFINDIAKIIQNWDSARLFAECIDKSYFSSCSTEPIEKQGFEQVVTRFEKFLTVISSADQNNSHYGLLVHDNHDQLSKKHTKLMKDFHKSGTIWTEIKQTFETPFFVNSELTEMIQIADLCAYALRRYLDYNESKLFDLIFERADRKNSVKVGVRHFTQSTCKCKICQAHKKKTRVISGIRQRKEE